VYGRGIVLNAMRASRRIGLRVGRALLLTKDMSPIGLRRRARSATLRCILYGGVTGNGAVEHFRALAAGRPDRRFFGSDGVVESAFTDPRVGGIPASIARRTLMTVATLGVRDFPAEGQAMFTRFRSAFGVRSVDPFATYGYEAMRIVLEAVARAGPRGSDRTAVLDAFFSTGERRGVLGTYSFDANGDTTLRTYGIYEISRGYPTYRRAIVARGIE
jgi:branched-chain amino acid transport system substrate-binding protein